MMNPTSCRAFVIPDSPITNALPPGICDAQKSAVASALVQIACSGTSSPDARSRAARSRGVKIELLVSTRNGVPRSVHCRMRSAAPGSGEFSCTSTPSMSVSQHSTSPRSLMRCPVARRLAHGVIVPSRCFRQDLTRRGSPAGRRTGFPRRTRPACVRTTRRC
jgi:hypothetical protein